MEDEQNKQYLEFLRKEKPLCVIEQRKAPQLYAAILEDIQHHDAWDGDPQVFHLCHVLPEGREVAMAWHPDDLAQYYRMLYDRWCWEENPAFMLTQLGVLFGYATDDIQAFVDGVGEGTISCDCSKCLGVFEAAKRQGDPMPERWDVPTSWGKAWEFNSYFKE